MYIDLTLDLFSEYEAKENGIASITQILPKLNLGTMVSTIYHVLAESDVHADWSTHKLCMLIG